MQRNRLTVLRDWESSANPNARMCFQPVDHDPVYDNRDVLGYVGQIVRAEENVVGPLLDGDFDIGFAVAFVPKCHDLPSLRLGMQRSVFQPAFYAISNPQRYNRRDAFLAGVYSHAR